MTSVEACSRCGLPVFPNASQAIKNMGTVCCCPSAMRVPARHSPVQVFDSTKGVSQPYNKYGARKVTVDGYTFDSQKEANRYQELKLRQLQGAITDLECQPKYEFVVNGVKVASYKADFRYKKWGQEEVVEDCKSEATRKIRDYPIRKKLLKACFDIDLVEV